MPVRLKDIATDLNLSKMTISKVLRGQTDVGEETRRRVLERARELNYQPNISARNLRTGQTSLVGAIVPDMQSPFFCVLVSELVPLLRERGYDVLVGLSGGDAETERQAIARTLSQHVDALLIASMQPAVELRRLMQPHATPLLTLAGNAPARNDAVALPDMEVGRVAALHLADVGCRTVAYIRGGRSMHADQRLQGFLQGVSEARMQCVPLHDADANDLEDYQRGTSAVRRLLQLPRRPQGIACCSDLAAVGAIDALLEAGVAVPKDVAVLGCGNESSFCHMKVPLSSVDLQAKGVALQASRMLLRLLEGGTGGVVRSQVVTPVVVKRQSTSRRERGPSQSKRKGGPHG